MIDVLKFDLFKARKSVSTWIIVVCVCIFTFASLGITYVSKSEGELPEVALEIGEQITTQSVSEMTVVDWCVDAITGDFLLLFIVVFAVIFVSSDFSSGYIKNIYGCIERKISYVVSKIMIISFFSILIIAVSYISCVIFNYMIIKSGAFGDIGEFLKFTFFKLLLSVAFGSIVSCITIVVKKATASMVICMGYSFMFVNIFYTGINQVLNNVFEIEDFNIEKYTVIGNTISLNLNISSEQSTIIGIISMLAILISIVFGSIIFGKSDI